MESLDLLSARAATGTAVLDGRLGSLTVARLRALRDEWCERLRADRKLLVEIGRPRTVDGLAAYLAALSLGHAVWLVDGAPPDLAAASRAAFRPDVTVLDGAVTRSPAGSPPHPALAMVVSTSGSVGAPKAVRLSYDNLAANARAIAAATGLRPGERAATSLPADYAFGLSVVNSHLISHGVLALTDAPPTARSFWWQVDRLGAAAIAVLPTTCRLLLSRGWHPRDHPSVDRVLIAGGRIDPPEVTAITGLMDSVGGRVNVMYGQTEATARISVLDATAAAADPGSVGRVVPGGTVTIVDGEVVYTGPNVMLGYATSRADLGLGDTQGGRLRTGDLGYLANGLLYLTGRADRQVKVLGRRVQLDRLEAELRTALRTEVVVVAHTDETIAVCHEGGAAGAEVYRIAARWGLPRGCVRVSDMPLPRLSSGKLDYRGVRARLDEVT